MLVCVTTPICQEHLTLLLSALPPVQLAHLGLPLPLDMGFYKV